MLIPKFSLDQTSDSVTIQIHSPYTNIEDTEIYVNDHEFVFSSTPYHLRLHLPGKIVENVKSTAKYECETGIFFFTFEKDTKGENFEGLNMITSLMAPKDMPDVNPSLIEIIGSSDDNRIVESDDIDNVSCNSASLINNNFSYGFANKLAGSFRDLGGEFPNIFELKTPEDISVEGRRDMRKQHENSKFSSDHYLADYFDEELIAPYLSYEIPWDYCDAAKESHFTTAEVEVLKELPNKEYLLNKEEFDSVMCNLVDILFAYCYEKRTTCNENTVESSWTINRLSATLSWFETFTSLEETLITCYRRALIYPMYRNFKLCCNVKDDVTKIFKIGRLQLVKSLIEIYQLFNSSQDARYILNQLYMRDFLIFSQKCSDNTYKRVYQKLDDLTINKMSLNLELIEYEEAAKIVQIEESQILENTMALNMASLKLSDDDQKSCDKPKNVSISLNSSGSYDSSSDSSDSSSNSSSDLDSDDESSSSS